MQRRSHCAARPQFWQIHKRIQKPDESIGFSGADGFVEQQMILPTGRPLNAGRRQSAKRTLRPGLSWAALRTLPNPVQAESKPCNFLAVVGPQEQRIYRYELTPFCSALGRSPGQTQSCRASGDRHLRLRSREPEAALYPAWPSIGRTSIRRNRPQSPKSEQTPTLNRTETSAGSCCNSRPPWV